MFTNPQAVLDLVSECISNSSLLHVDAISVNGSRNATRTWSTTLVFPPAITVASLLTLVAHSVYQSFGKGANHGRDSTTDGQSGPVSRWRTQISHLGGPTIVFFNVVRLLSSVILFGLSVYTALSMPGSHYSRWIQYGLCTTYGYASLLLTWALSTNPLWSRILIRHSEVVLLATWVVFVYRDIWPLGTYTLQPADMHEGPIFWVKFGILTLGAIIVPLVIPHQYIPYDPEDPFMEINPEQTTSLISRMLYIYIDPIITSASKVDHLPLEQLPPLCDSDAMKNLVARSFKYIDPLQSGSSRHLFWKLLRVFAFEHVELVTMLLLMVISGYIAPVGINRILAYLETGGQGALIRPWVWIILLLLGPLLATVTSARYSFVVGRMITQIQGIVTQVILDHALRIRLKADVPESSDKKVAAAVSTPDTVSIADEGETSTLAEDQRSSNSEDHSATAASGSAGARPKDSSSIKDVGTKPREKKEGNMIGKINNLVTTDLSTLEFGQSFLFLLFFIPFQIALGVVFLYAILGWSVFVGVGVMLALVFLSGMVTKLSHGVQVEKMKRSDARVQTVTEALGGVIRTVKLFGWEQKMSERIDTQRQEELKAVRKTKLLWVATTLLTNLVPMVAMVVTFTVYTLIMKKELTASRVFSSVAVFETLQHHFKGVANIIPVVIQAKVAIDRINDFLLKTELLDVFSTTEGTSTLSPDSSSPDVIGIRAATFTWDNNPASGTETPGSKKRNFKLCINDELMFKRGHMNLVIGQTGSGKTSLLMALLGEMHYIPMGPGSMVSLPRGGGVAYHAQESWVMNETIRNNILFGSPYDEERYKKVIEQCALERDLSLFDAGDETEVGEKGITLSGGQKARITLARAVYSQAAILLLDDVLAALDVHTAQWIVDKCFQGDLIQGRTVILVTHNVALATPIAEYVVCLSPDGGVLSTGSLSSALAKDKKLSAQVAEESKQLEEADQEITEPKPDVAAQNSEGKLVVAEEISVGHVGWTPLKLLFSNTSSGTVGLIVFWAVYFGAMFLSRLAITTESWVLALWARQYEIHMGDPSEVSVSRYLSVYVAIFVFSLITSAISFTVFFFGTIRASRVIHKTLIETLLRSTLRWLDKTPSSRIITRCTQDIAAIDGNVVAFFNNLVYITCEIVLKLGSVIILSPIFALPGILMGVVGGWLGHLYMKAQLSVKRELSNAKSPVLGHIGAAIAGLISIRAYGSEEAFRQESFARINRFARAQRTFWDLNRWISVRGELLAGSFSTALSAYLVYWQRSDASSTGFSLTMAVGFSSMVLIFVRNFNDFEVQGNSLERIQQYLDIEQEPKPTPEGVPPASWPASGDLRVENLSARYSADGPKVLVDISFHVKSGERVGIVGRTGSGKSSLTLALLRCILTEGAVYYDGLATDKINLDVLRSHITIIPQVPEMLSGTLRENIDPFSQYEDAVLNDALRSAGLFSLQSETDEGRLTLDSDVSSGGSNLSVGQRQIIALARAIVRQSKLLILDEATSAIDYETDSIIQESLRKEVAKDVTLLTVAHRLQTVMDSDKIMVLDAGRIVEFGKPTELLENEKSFLRSLVDASGDKEKLYAMAAGDGSL